MRRWLVPSALLAVLLALPAATVHASHPGGSAEDVYVNVVSVSRVGCGDDGTLFEGDPDYRVQVFHDGALVLDTGKAQDRESPLFASLVRLPHPARPVELTFRVDEAEPGGFLGTGTTWRDCDASPNPGKDLQVSWDGGLLSRTYRGDEADAVELHLVVGETPPAVPALTVSHGTTTATASWDADANGLATTHRLRWSPLGTILHSAGATAGSHTVPDLCDNAGYALQVLREDDDWVVASEAASFTTDNLPPGAPTPRWAEIQDTNLSVAWYSPTWHDAWEYQLHAGPAGFTPGPGTLFATVPGEAQVTFAEHAWAGPTPEGTHVLVRTVDTAGAHADSTPLAVGDENPAGPPPGYDCPHAAVPGRLNPFADPSEPKQAEDPPTGTPAEPPGGTGTDPPPDPDAGTGADPTPTGGSDPGAGSDPYSVEDPRTPADDAGGADDAGPRTSGAGSVSPTMLVLSGLVGGLAVAVVVLVVLLARR